MTARNDWASVPTQLVEIAGTQLAYRRLGPREGMPIVFLNHWGANLDGVDPHLVEGLAVDRPVLALDYRGIGRSGGSAPLTVVDTARDVIAAMRALTAGPVAASIRGSHRLQGRCRRKKGPAFDAAAGAGGGVHGQ